MDRGVLKALEIGYRAGLYAWPLDDAAGVVRVEGGYLEFGPLASPDAIVTVVCRYVVERRRRGRTMPDELEVMRRVEAHGFVYMPPGTWTTTANANAVAVVTRALCS